MCLGILSKRLRYFLNHLAMPFLGKVDQTIVMLYWFWDYFQWWMDTNVIIYSSSMEERNRLLFYQTLDQFIVSLGLFS